MIKCTALSDLHGDLPEIEPTDLVFICGDILPLRIQRDIIRSQAWLANFFIPWAMDLGCQHVVFIAGNHDFFFEKLENSDIHPKQLINLLCANAEVSKKVHYLENTAIRLHVKTDEGTKSINVWGTPHCPSLANWAFYGDDQYLKWIWDEFPTHSDVILTHCPPRWGKYDISLDRPEPLQMEFGMQQATDALLKSSCSGWVLCGHIHSGSHIPGKIGNYNICNVSIKNEEYQAVYKPFKFILEK